MIGGPVLVHEFLSGAVERVPDRRAIVTPSRVVTFVELAREADVLATHLQASGLRRGDRVAILLDNSVEAVVALFAALRAGGVFVNVNPTTKRDRLAFMLNDCTVHTLITQPSLAREVSPARLQAPALRQVIWTEVEHGGEEHDAALPEILSHGAAAVADPGLLDEDLCAIVYTSGSTGRPKGVMLTHHNMANTAWSISTFLENTPDDIVIDFLPLAFDYGLYQVITGARVGFTVVLEKSFAFPYDTLRTIVQQRVTGLPGVPSVFARLLLMDSIAGLDLSSLRYLSNTAAALAPAQIQRLRDLLPDVRIYSMYGLTECTRVSYVPPDVLDRKRSSVGKAIPNSEVYIVDAQGRRVGPGVTGELVVRGANVMRGYWGDPAATERRLRDGDLVGEKVLYSGDLFSMDEDGYLYFVGRMDDVFKCRGEKISPKEVEDVLLMLPDVVEAAVVGVDDEIDGKAIMAVLVLKPGALLSERDVRRHCAAHLETFKVPRFVEFRDSIPKTESGKLRKTELIGPAAK